MSAALGLWTRIAAGTALALALGLILRPAHPPVRVAWPVAAVLGTAGGVSLFVASTRRPPLLPVLTSSTSVGLAKLGFLGLWATNEEVIWRRVALGELLSWGMLPAFVASTVGFALVHRPRRWLHIGTGGAFAALYLSTGVLAASIAAHWVYNVLVGSLVQRRRRREDLPP